MGSKQVEVNCDMGEGFGKWKMGPDEELMKFIDVANVACGFHAGDPSIMLRTLRLAKQHGVRVGAHPGFPDLFGFGRRRMEIDPEDMYALMLYQVGALVGILEAEGMKLNHVKPHGQLYFYVHKDEEIRDAVVRAVSKFNVPLYGLPHETMKAACAKYGVTLVHEFYPDIQYDETGHLAPVKGEQANGKIVGQRLEEFARDGHATTADGVRVDLGFGDLSRATLSICVHSDFPTALENAAAVRQTVDRVFNA
ncbi:Lactam utilization protein lamB [Colletotrichum orbiculare MAFF 240422]|uniref:Lactam utilization protein lamB n=1 Tax=Colletotrichum orbiculare (strain 104-T / ATCC 96160 / CBS 514.97 / LARS 414 / MAFF 240422) TaxID=1213857 RepID=N4VLC9_COLOR|nr:Lactam utilization protein lamB [Colletotrichum orbiculare MAFF 240422]